MFPYSSIYMFACLPLFLCLSEDILKMWRHTLTLTVTSHISAYSVATHISTYTDQWGTYSHRRTCSWDFHTLASCSTYSLYTYMYPNACQGSTCNLLHMHNPCIQSSFRRFLLYQTSLLNPGIPRERYMCKIQSLGVVTLFLLFVVRIITLN
jgi:hypothetical protein